MRLAATDHAPAYDDRRSIGLALTRALNGALTFWCPWRGTVWVPVDSPLLATASASFQPDRLETVAIALSKPQ